MSSICFSKITSNSSEALSPHWRKAGLLTSPHMRYVLSHLVHVTPIPVMSSKPISDIISSVKPFLTPHLGGYFL